MKGQFLTAGLCFSFLIISIPKSLHAVGASGLSSQLVGVKALGQANAFVAQADDPSAIYFNPAGLTQLDGLQTTLGVTGVEFDTEFKGSGVSESMDKEYSFLPHFYLSGMLPSSSDRKWALGFGVTTPFGLATEWSKTGFARYVTTKSELRTSQYNPTIAFAPNKQISFGLGVDYLSVDEISLESQVDQSLVGGADGNQKLEGDGGEWGYNAGVLWKPVEKHSFGASYRSEFKVHIDGKITLNEIDPTIQALFNFPGSSYSTSVETDITFPQSAILGYYFVPNERWTLLFDYEWTDWSAYKKNQLDIKESDPFRSSLLNANNPIARNWKDVHAFALGNQYNFRNGLKLRMGYSYFNTAVPEETWEPGVPDSDQHTIATGLGYSWGDLTLDAAYNVILFENRSISNSVGAGSINGKYETLVNVIGLGFTYKFLGSK